MLLQLHDALKEQLLVLEGMIVSPYVSATGNASRGVMIEFPPNGRHFACLRLTDKYRMLYLSPLHCFPDLDAQYAERLKSVRAEKSCLKITKPEKFDRSAIDAILKEGAVNWPTN